MVGVHGVYDVWLYAAAGKVMVVVGVGSKRYTGCNERLKRDSGGQNSTGEGRLLVVEEQTWCVSVKVEGRSSVSWMSCTSLETSMREEEKLNHASKRVWENGAYSPNSYYKPTKIPPNNVEKDTA